MDQENPATEDTAYLTPVDGKFIFQIASNVRVRFNAEGWVEEIGKGGSGDPLGTTLQARSGTTRDDIYARRYYDLFTRVVIFDIQPRLGSSNSSGAGGLVLFKDLEVGSPIYDRVNKIIEISNQAFKTDLTLLG
tara:strand:- start:45570 stop:45971 length:402 start_codon:yes stop_codon:yes gene_type:complete